MAKNQGKPTKFIRVRGKIIPIFAKEGAESARDLGSNARYIKKIGSGGGSSV